jgi:hypothetical protein
MSWQAMLDLVRVYDAFVLHLVANLKPGCLANVWGLEGKKVALEHLARDCYRHLDWHIVYLDCRVSEVKGLRP